MLTFVCIGFTSCGHEADMDPITTETVVDGLDIDVRGEDPEEDTGNGEKSEEGN